MVITGEEKQDPGVMSSVPTLSAIGQMGGARDGQTSRVKDFEILSIPSTQNPATRFVVASGSSDGTIRIWMLDQDVLLADDRKASESPGKDGRQPLKPDATGAKEQGPAQDSGSVASIGKLLGTYDTGNRITCLKAFVMSNHVGSDTRGSEESETVNKEDGAGWHF